MAEIHKEEKLPSVVTKKEVVHHLAGRLCPVLLCVAMVESTH